MQAFEPDGLSPLDDFNQGLEGLTRRQPYPHSRDLSAQGLDDGCVSVDLFQFAHAVALLGTAQHGHDELRDFAGLWQSGPVLASLMTVFLLSLGGFPPTAGFIGKWYIFSAAIEQGHYWLAIIGVLTSVVSVFFYLRIVVMMYMTEGSEIPRPRVPIPAAAGLAIATAAVFYLGILPTWIIDLARDSISTIF
jgi:NADH-quinone oxidoreductase subunit N